MTVAPCGLTAPACSCISRPAVTPCSCSAAHMAGSHATIIHTAAGQAALQIQFAAPSPLGLLTAYLVADSQPAADATAIADGRH